MVVTLRASYTESEKCFTGNVGHFCENQIPLHSRIALIPFVDAESEKRSANQFVRIIRSEFVGGDLLTDKLVVGFIVVKRFDHIVPVAPRIGPIIVGTIPITFGVSNDVKPVLSPAFSVSRAR